MSMTKQIPWLRIFAEGVVIVVSILLALAGEACWVTRIARQTAVSELESVLVELDEARQQIEVVGRQHPRLGSITVALQQDLEASSLDQVLTVPDTMLAGLLVLSVADPPTAVIDAFTSSGHLDEIRSPDLRRELLAWSSLLRDLRDDEILAREFQQSEVWPYLLSEVDIARAADLAADLVTGRLDVRLPGTVGAVQLRVTTSLKNLVALQARFFRLLTRQSINAVTRLEEMAKLIREELDGD